MKGNITPRLDAELIKEAKILAAQRGTSVSRMLVEQLEELIRREKDYVAAGAGAAGERARPRLVAGRLAGRAA